jgi:hypothetical protein
MNMTLSHTTRVLLTVIATFVLSLATAPLGRAASQPNERMWQGIEASSLDPAAERLIVPAVYRTVRLDQMALTQALAAAPMEFTREAAQNPGIIFLPMPDGTMARFRFEESPVIEAGLAAKFPNLKTYRAQGIDDPAASARFDWLPTGFHAIILSSSGTVLIDPYAKGDTTNYITYWKRDAANLAGNFMCNFKDSESVAGSAGGVAPAVTSGTQLRTYRLALACTVEYATAVGSNTVAGALAAEVLIMNRVNGVYERDVAIHMTIIANNNLITYAADNLSCGGACTTANDPYTNDDGATMLDQNQANINTVIGAANYDIGHVFSTGGGGIAQLAVPCGASKARGVTGLPSPIGDPFAIDYVCHEMGHQWGANHTFNSTTGSCGGGNRSGGSAYEPGSGVTIMAYSGICGNQNLANFSLDNFHVKSLEAIVAYSQTGAGNGCAVTTATGNTPPTVTGPGNFNIPKNTPFYLTANATDPNGDSLTYSWEEYDLGGSTTATPNTDSDGSPRPIFRPFLPTVGGTRIFPALQHILNSANVPPTFGGGFMTGELLPAITRTMTFQVTARDNRANGGGINTATSTVTIDGAATPFAVLTPNDAISIQRLTNYNVTWNASGPAANVKISLSTDGGTTFPTVLAASTANDGNELVPIPDMLTSTGRIKIEAVGNIYFDISDNNFSIITGVPSPTPTATSTVAPSATPSCTPGWSFGPAVPGVAASVRAPGNYFPANGKFYSIGGRSADTAGADFTHPFEYDPGTNAWTTKPSTIPDLKVNNMACGVMSVGGTDQIYCVGGSQSQVVGTTGRVFSYNPATDTFTTLAAGDDWPGSQTGTFLPGGFAVAANKLYLIGSFNANAVPPVMTNQVWQFDPNGAVGSKWLARTNYPQARGYVPAATIGGFIYTGGGSALDPAGALIDSAESYKYDPVSGAWTAITNIPRVTGETRAVVMNGKMWVLGGGRTVPNPSNEVDIYDPVANSWSTGVPFTTARRNFAADSNGTDHVYIAGGYDTALSNTMEIFGPAICATPTPSPTATPGTPTPSPTISASPTIPPVSPTPPPATPTPTPSATIVPSPTPTPATQPVNLSTRMRVQTGENVGIGGFIISGTAPKHVLVRAIGPSLSQFGVPNPLPDPVLELHGPAGFSTVTNNNWADDPAQAALIVASGLAPTSNLESAIDATLNPGAYTAVVSGNNSGVGVGLIEVYDLSQAVLAKLANISTRAFISTGDNVVIAGFVLGNNSGLTRIVIRGLGPSLIDFGVANALANPTLELRDNNAAVLATNDDWGNNPELIAAGLAPTNAAESGIAITLGPGQYTAILSGVNNTSGVGVVEVYDRGAP